MQSKTKNTMKTIRNFLLIGVGALSCICCADKAAEPKAEGSYRLCDFHQHTTFSDGVFSLGYDFEACDSIDLAWWANSEHGGPSPFNGLISKIKNKNNQQIKNKKADKPKIKKIKSKEKKQFHLRSSFNNFIEKFKPEHKAEVKAKKGNQMISAFEGFISQVKLRNNLVKLLLILSAIGFPLAVIFIIVALNRSINKKINESLNENIDENPEENAFPQTEPVVPVMTESEQEEEEPQNDVIDEHPKDSFSDYIQQDATLDEKPIDEGVDTSEILQEEPVEEPIEEPAEPLEEEEEEFEYFNDNVEEDAESENIQDFNDIIDEAVDTEYTPDGYINEFETDDDDSIFEELRNNTLDFEDEADDDSSDNVEIVESDTSDDAQPEDTLKEQEVRGEYETTVDGLTVLTHTPIDSVSGFYLVNFENFSSLIGYIKDEIFVLKTFDEFVNNSIYVKPAEHLAESVFRYIVRVGIYKMVIEVTPTKMSHLIDL